MSNETVYQMTNKETGEVKMVLPHTFGDDYVEFADVGLTPEEWANPATLYKFANIGQEGNLTSDVYDIKVADISTPTEASVEEATPTEEEVVTPIEETIA